MAERGAMNPSAGGGHAGPPDIIPDIIPVDLGRTCFFFFQLNCILACLSEKNIFTKGEIINCCLLSFICNFKHDTKITLMNQFGILYMNFMFNTVEIHIKNFSFFDIKCNVK